MVATIPLTAEAIKEYLDNSIRFWRKEHSEGNSVAECYIDAYQSMRMSLFGKTLDREWERGIGDKG